MILSIANIKKTLETTKKIKVKNSERINFRPREYTVRLILNTPNLKLKQINGHCFTLPSFIKNNNRLEGKNTHKTGFKRSKDV